MRSVFGRTWFGWFQGLERRSDGPPLGRVRRKAAPGDGEGAGWLSWGLSSEAIDSESGLALLDFKEGIGECREEKEFTLHLLVDFEIEKEVCWFVRGGEKGGRVLGN
ncbi:hypothetical protein OIU76_020817 [Salix suchowensis]|nr:hypothetical protein OIU76_020817 [Salix suchowensis]